MQKKTIGVTFMQIQVTTENGYLPAAYSKFANDNEKSGRYPIQSFPFEVTDLPAGTKYLAWAFIDFDSIPVMGFPWIHWLAANYPVTGDTVSVPANLAQLAANHKTDIVNDGFVQGENSSYSRYIQEKDPKLKQTYIGPVPPDHDHRYTLMVIACKDKLPVTAGFFLNELHHLEQDNPAVILAKASVDILAKA